MSPRTGRPPKNASSRDKKLNIRLSQNELNDIEYVADKLKLSRTDAIVKGINELKVEIEKE